MKSRKNGLVGQDLGLEPETEGGQVRDLVGHHGSN